MKYNNIIKAKKVYENKKNVIDYLKKQLNIKKNTSEIIEQAYDLQAGSYIASLIANRVKRERFSDELALELNKYLTPSSTLLDIGSGELTTLTLTLNKLKKLQKVFAFDISWSRIFKGLDFLKNNLRKKKVPVCAFVADIKSIPLQSNSIDVVTSCHALEPNGGNLNALLKELFRVTKDKLVLFEPSYEMNSSKGKKRMDKLGYIKGIEKEATKLGGVVKSIKLIKNIDNPLNPTACYVISVKKKYIHKNISKFTVPGSDYKLRKINNFMISKDTGLSFPVLKGIPILKPDLAIISTALFY